MTVGGSPFIRTAGWGSVPRIRPAAVSTSGVERKLVRSPTTATPGRWSATSRMRSGSAPFHP
ncbi:MAG: hypothetical protein GWN48_02735 [Actinobacteria bacterium]|nr:hypothetical protein [Actinomycetota bacterium]